MPAAERIRDSVVAVPGTLRAARPRGPVDVLFVAVMALLLAVHATIFFAVLVTAPVTAAERASLDLLHLPVEAARALTLPFEVLLLGSLWILGSRHAGRWAGMAAIFAVLALDLRADRAAVVYGPSVATGGWAAAALLAAALVVVPRHRLAAAALLGAAAVCHGLAVVALPAFLLALAMFPDPTGAGRRARLASLARFVGMWAVPFGLGQLLWLADLGADAYARRAAVFAGEFAPHPLVPFVEQQIIVFSAWHFPVGWTIPLAAFLFLAAAVGVVRYFLTPRPEETGPRLLAVARRLPVDLWAAGLSLLAFSTWWAFSGARVVIDPNLPVMAAVVPLITAMAYRGAKWLLTVNRFWALCAVVYLTGLVLARSTQLLLTLLQAFQR